MMSGTDKRSIKSQSLVLNNLGYAYRKGQDPIFKQVDLKLNPGECHCFCGPTGSGKSTLMMSVKGLFESGRLDGQVQAEGDNVYPADAIGIVMQNPETQILCQTVGDEISLGIRKSRSATVPVSDRVADVLDLVGLDKALDFEVNQLSMGEKYRLILAATLITGPKVLILDEPAAQLDKIGTQQLLNLISRLKADGLIILISEHKPDLLKEIIDNYWYLNESKTLRSIESGALTGSTVEIKKSRTSLRQGDVQIEGTDLSFSYDKNRVLWDQLSFQIRKGDRVVIRGKNGQGKTTLTRCLTGFLKPSTGNISVFGASPSPKTIRGRMGFLYQNPQRQIFENTVFEEVSFGLRRKGTFVEQTEAIVLKVLEELGISDLAHSSPFKLSYGQQHTVGLASVLALEPEVMILDDPFTGFDQNRFRLVRGILSRLNEEKGITIIWTEHNQYYGENWADMILDLERLP